MLKLYCVAKGLMAPMKKLEREKVPASVWRGMTAAVAEAEIERREKRICLVENIVILVVFGMKESVATRCLEELKVLHGSDYGQVFSIKKHLLHVHQNHMRFIPPVIFFPATMPSGVPQK